MHAYQTFTVVYFGDSLTAGSELPADEKAFVWPRLVEEMSQGKFKGINEGLGGRPTDSLPDFQKVMEQHGKVMDLLVIALGGNDARDISGNCVPNAVKNIREMVHLARTARPGIPLLLVGPANIFKEALGPTKPIANERDQNLRELNAAYAQLAPELGCQFVSLYGVIPAENLTRDGVHADGEGNRPVAVKMLEVLTRLAA